MSLSQVKKTNPNVLNYCRLKLQVRQTILNMAKKIGLEKFPPKTISALKNDDVYVFCFYPLIEPTPLNKKEKRERLAELLGHPKEMNDKDIVHGLTQLLNNFRGNMPGGYYRKLIQDWKYDSLQKRHLAETIKGYKLLFTRIDGLIQEFDFNLSLYLELRKSHLENAAATTLRMELPIFEALIGRYHYSREELIR